MGRSAQLNRRGCLKAAPPSEHRWRAGRRALPCGSYAASRAQRLPHCAPCSRLQRTCELESRLRQAIQDTHPLQTTLDWDFRAADKEREALLAIRCGARMLSTEGAGQTLMLMT